MSNRSASQAGTKATPSQNIGKGLAPFVKNVSAPAGKPEHLKAADAASQPDRVISA